MLTRVLLLATLVASMSGCAGSGSGANPSAQPSTIEVTTATTPAEQEVANDETGKMTFAYQDATSPEAINGKKFMQEHHLLEGFADMGDGMLLLPFDIPVNGKQCGEANAFWEPGDKSMSMCYEFADDLMTTFAGNGDADPAKSTDNVLTEVFFHEMGHMAIDIYDLPVTGREEDVADQLAAYMLLQPDEQGRLDPENVQAILDVVREYDARGHAGDLDETQFADTHSLDLARMYNMLCWLYGADPEGQANLVTDGRLPQSRADSCDDEWAKLDRAWSTLLEPHLKS